MTFPPLASGIGWEQRLFAFLRAELAPSPARWRDALRLTLLCAIGTIGVLAFHLPYGEFLLIFFFAVSQPDAWASLRKARMRGIGTLLGGLFAIVAITVCADKPWLFFAVQSLVFFAALFLSRTTTVPYAVILAMFTFVIVTPAAATEPELSLETVFWRIALTVAGAVIGTVAQLVLWPDNPERRLLRSLAAQLQMAEASLNRVAARDTSLLRQKTQAPAHAAMASRMANQLDLLTSAEAGSRWLRQRHAQQIKLITDVEMILLATLRLERLVERESPPADLAASIRERAQVISHTLARLRRALEDEKTPVAHIEEWLATAVVESEVSPIRTVIGELERAVRQLPVVMAFLSVEGRPSFNPLAEELIAERSIFTSECTLANVEVVRFALKGTLAASICYVLYQALNWPGISTSVVTCLITAQSSFGAGLQKSFMRLAGAILGGLLAVFTVVVVLPNMEGVTSFVIVTSILFFAASWLTTGSSQISYIGLQMGLILALVLLNRADQSIALAPAGDRILGVLLGVVVMGFIDFILWPNFAGTALRRQLADILRKLAAIPRCAARQAWDEAGGVAFGVHRKLAAVLGLYNEWQREFVSHGEMKEGARQQWLTVTNRVEELFLTLLAILRHRGGLDSHIVPAALRSWLQEQDETIARCLEAMADRSGEPVPLDFNRLAADLANELKAARVIMDASPAHANELAGIPVLYRELAEAFQHLAADLSVAVDGLPEPSTVSLPAANPAPA